MVNHFCLAELPMVNSWLMIYHSLVVSINQQGLNNTIAGWWLGHPSEKYEFVNWDDEIPNISGNIKNGNQTTNQIIRACRMGPPFGTLGHRPAGQVARFFLWVKQCHTPP